MRGEFPSVVARDEAEEKFQAVEGGRQTIERLAEHVVVAHASEGRELRLERIFDAPPNLVFEAWSKAEHLSKWFSPSGFSMAKCEMELRAGGPFPIAFRGPDGKDYRSDSTFTEVVPDRKIASFGTLHGGIDVHTTVTFEAVGDKTRLEARQLYSNESLATRGAPIGWGQTLDHLAAHLER